MALLFILAQLHQKGIYNFPFKYLKRPTVTTLSAMPVLLHLLSQFTSGHKLCFSGFSGAVKFH